MEGEVLYRYTKTCGLCRLDTFGHNFENFHQKITLHGANDTIASYHQSFSSVDQFKFIGRILKNYQLQDFVYGSDAWHYILRTGWFVSMSFT